MYLLKASFLGAVIGQHLPFRMFRSGQSNTSPIFDQNPWHLKAPTPFRLGLRVRPELVSPETSCLISVRPSRALKGLPVFRLLAEALRTEYKSVSALTI